MRDQRQQARQPKQRKALIIAARQTALEQYQQVIQQHGLWSKTLQITQKILEGKVALQVLTQATAPSKILCLRDRARLTEPQGCLGRQIGMQVVKVLGGQGIQITGLRALGELNQGFSEIIPNRLAVLGDNRTVI